MSKIYCRYCKYVKVGFPKFFDIADSHIKCTNKDAWEYESDYYQRKKANGYNVCSFINYWGDCEHFELKGT